MKISPILPKKAFWIRTPLNYRKSDFGVGFCGNGATGLCDEFKLYFVLNQCVIRSGAATCGHKKTAQHFGIAASLFAVFNTVRFSTTLWRSRGIERRCACPAGFCYRKNSIPKRTPIGHKKRQVLQPVLIKPSGVPVGIRTPVVRMKILCPNRARRQGHTRLLKSLILHKKFSFASFFCKKFKIFLFILKKLFCCRDWAAKFM